MARSSKSSRRDTFDIASDQLLADPDSSRSGRELLDLEDRRSFYPGVYRPAARLRGRVFLSMPKASVFSPRKRMFSPVISFRAPDGVLICVRRHRRREVLFAKKRAGRGGMRKPRRNLFSSISCKR